MAVDQDTQIFFYPRIKLVMFGLVKGSNTISYLGERGDLRWRAIEYVLVLDCIRDRGVIMQ